MEIKWKIKSLERLIETGAVTCVHFYVYLEDNGEPYKETSVQKLDLTGEVTTPYADLTETQVIGWVKDALGDEAVTAAESEMADFIPVTGKAEGIPW